MSSSAAGYDVLVEDFLERAGDDPVAFLHSEEGRLHRDQFAKDEGAQNRLKAKLAERGLSVAEIIEEPEPDMSLLHGSRRPPVPMPLNLFGPFWSDWIQEQAEVKSAPPDYVAGGLLAAASIAVGNARWASPWEGWKEPPIIWLACVGNPSSNKSPALDAPLDLLRTLEMDINRGFADRRREYLAKHEAAKAAREQWQQDVREATKAGRPTPPMPETAEEPRPLSRIRLVATDATSEMLGRLLQGNPRGILYFRDELAGWLGQMDRYGNGGGADRALWLEAYSGRSYAIDRVKHADDPICIPKFTIGLTGGIQPDRLASSLLAGDDDGLAARVLYVWPDPVPPKRPRPSSKDQAAERALRRLHDLQMPPDQNGELSSQIIMFSDEAADALHKFRVQNAEREQAASGMFLSWLGKMPGVVCRLALLFEYLWWAGGQSEEPAPPKVKRTAVFAAAALVEDYLIPMAERVFGDAALTEAERNAATLARYIVKHHAPGTTVNARDLLRKKLPKLRDAASVYAALELLVEGGLLIPVPTRAGGTQGRMKKDYRVNPKLGRQSYRR
jgi:Protein of unknown function (DUF3987)